MISFSSKACFFTSSSKYIEAILDCIKWQWHCVYSQETQTSNNGQFPGAERQSGPVYARGRDYPSPLGGAAGKPPSADDVQHLQRNQRCPHGHHSQSDGLQERRRAHETRGDHLRVNCRGGEWVLLGLSNSDLFVSRWVSRSVFVILPALCAFLLSCFSRWKHYVKMLLLLLCVCVYMCVCLYVLCSVVLCYVVCMCVCVCVCVLTVEWLWQIYYDRNGVYFLLSLYNCSVCLNLKQFHLSIQSLNPDFFFFFWGSMLLWKPVPA